jgi:hypothetical protein
LITGEWQQCTVQSDPSDAEHHRLDALVEREELAQVFAAGLGHGIERVREDKVLKNMKVAHVNGELSQKGNQRANGSAFILQDELFRA